MESLSIKLKRMKYHLTEIGAKVVVIDQTSGNVGKILYGWINRVNYFDNIKMEVEIIFVRDNKQVDVVLPIFSPYYELTKMIKLQSSFLFDSATYAEMFVKSLDIDDVVTLVRTDYITKLSFHDVKVSGIKIRTFNTSQIMPYHGRSNKPHIHHRSHSYACGITPGSRNYIDFILFKKITPEDQKMLLDYFDDKINDYNEITDATSTKTFKNQVAVYDADKKFNKFMREYNTKIVFDYLKDIIPEEDI